MLWKQCAQMITQPHELLHRLIELAFLLLLNEILQAFHLSNTIRLLLDFLNNLRPLYALN